MRPMASCSLSGSFRASTTAWFLGSLCLLGYVGGVTAAEPVFRAGAAAANITPPLGDEIVGGFHPFPATHVHDELHARCLVLDDGSTRLAIVVCDLLGFHRSVGDEARRLIQQTTGIPAEHVLICATHTHSATTALGGGGLERYRAIQKPLAAYQTFVARRIADGVHRAANLLRPAEAAWGTIDIPEHLFNRRWFMRPGTMPENPFGSADDLVKMNPPSGSPNLDKPAGPTDPTLSFLLVREPDGPPIGLFATYSLHYVGGVGPGHISADYFGMACDELERLVGRQPQDPPFVAMLANGTSGDINNINFLEPRPARKPYEQMRLVAHDVAAKIQAAIAGLAFHRDVPLAAVYREPDIATRRPTEKELTWARATLAMPAAGAAKKTLSEIYAERVQALAEQPESLALPLQLLKIGPARVGTMPCEVFCEIGLDFRARCAGKPAFLVSLAHGYYGYLPTPRQLDFGGYETWPGTNRLERDASTKMLATLLEMAGERPAAPQPAEQSRRGLQVDPGLTVELVAAEPEVIDPVALAFDADGVLWVAEMGDYPTGPPDGGPPRSRIRRLEDRDGDGRYEQASVFAAGLSFCTGLHPWRDGLIVTRAGGIDHLRDTDGDGRADRREPWFTGFAEQNSQLRANHPRLGIDGLFAVANGLRGGTVLPADARWQAPTPAGIDIRGRDFRFDPRGGLCEAITGVGQFGLSFDDAGTRFICTNRNPCIQVMFEDRDLRRQPALALTTAVQDAAPAAERSRLHPLSRGWTTSNLHANQFSAACGVHIHRGDGLPAAYVGNAFVCEPTGNLVHRDRLALHGVAWQAVPNETGREFLASADEWFRPVALADGPDGCLYVADMHRAVIEHPEFMPPELAARPDLRAGDDRGRIYRIRSAGHRTGRSRPTLSNATSADLVAMLDHPNGWHRDTAARLLLERADPQSLPALADLALQGRSPAGRIRSLWLLERLGGLEPATLRAAARDADPQVRATAVMLAARFLPDDHRLAGQLLEAASDTDARVRFTAAVRLGDLPPRADDPATAALADLLRAAPDDRWLRAAVLSSSRGRGAALLAQLLDAATSEAASAIRESTAELAAVVGAATDEPATAVAEAITTAARSDSLAVPVLDGLCRGLERRRMALPDLTRAWPEPARAAVSRILAAAARVAGDAAAEPESRLLAVRLLRQAPADIAVPALLPLAANDADQPLRSAAIATVGRFDDPRIDDAMLADIQRQTPGVRRATLDACVARPTRAARLLDAIDRGDIAAAVLAPEHWHRLAQLTAGEIGSKVEQLRKANAPGDRQRVIDAYAAALEQPGDPVRGRAVFARVCAACHRVDGLGVNVGPDISDSRTKRPEQYLVDILDPNRAIDAGSFSCTVQLGDGRSLTGLIVTETGGSITLRQPEGGTVTLLRDEIDDLRTGSVSLMPVGLERLITVPQMADLIGFLKNWRYQSTTASAGPSPSAPPRSP